MHVIRGRMTSRAFRDDIKVPREYIEMVLEAAPHSRSGANAQLLHYFVVTEPGVKTTIANYFFEKARKRAKLKMKFLTSSYRGLEMGPVHSGAADSRFVRAFQVLLDGAALDRQTLSHVSRQGPRLIDQ